MNKQELWALRAKKKGKSAKINMLQTKVERLVNEIVGSCVKANWKEAIEATQDLASMMKTMGYGREAFAAMMENVEIGIEKSGVSRETFRHALRNKEYYLGKSKLMVM